MKNILNKIKLETRLIKRSKLLTYLAMLISSIVKFFAPIKVFMIFMVSDKKTVLSCGEDLRSLAKAALGAILIG